MGKIRKNYTLEEEKVQNFEKEVPRGRRSQVIEQLMQNYSGGETPEDLKQVDKKIRELENQKIQVEQEIESKKSKLAEIETELTGLKQKKQSIENERKQEEKVSEFVGDMVEKFDRSDYRNPEDWFSDYGSGNLKKLKNTEGVDLEIDELRERFLSRVEEDTGETE